MEPKKIKKLVINKETISSLNDYALSTHKGGAESGYVICGDYTKNTCPMQTWEDSCWNATHCGDICIIFPYTQSLCPTQTPFTPSGDVSCCVLC